MPEFFPVAVLLLAVATAAIGAVAGLRRSRRAGQVDPFHPLLFPSIYVSVACLAPPLWLWASGTDMGYIRRSELAPHTPQLMALAAVGFTLGCAIPYVRRAATGGATVAPRALGAVGRMLILMPLALAIRDYFSGAVLTRGLGQDSITLADSINALGVITGPTAVTLILASRFQEGKSLLSLGDYVLVAALIGLNGLNGERNSALAIMIAILIFLTRRRGAALRAVLGLSAILAFAYLVVVYRTNVMHVSYDLSVTMAVMQDIGSVTFTTGVTAALVSGHSYLDGASILAGLLRQMPGPVSSSLLGPPDDTGAFRFRAISGLTTDSNGFGFSLPAEGVLNFGAVGAFLVPFVVGALLAWMYARFTPTAARASQLLYVVAAGTLPYGFRSDTLGAVKGVLYPAVILAIAFLLAATAQHRRTTVSQSRSVRIPVPATNNPGDASETGGYLSTLPPR